MTAGIDPVETPPSDKKHIYHGWVVVTACFFIWAVAFGIQFSFGIFFKPLQDAFGWSRGTTSWVMTIHLIVFSLCVVPCGWIIDCFSMQRVFPVAALLIGGSLALCSRISEPWQLYLLYGFALGIGVSICGPAIPTIVTRWFSSRRGLALGITSAGVGFGTLSVAPLSNFLITAYGWRNAFLILGAGSCAILLACSRYIRNPPQPGASGQRPAAGDPTPENQARRPSPPTEMTFGQAVRTREFLLIVIAAASGNITNRVILVHIAPHAIDIGISPLVAALAVATFGGSSLVGRLVMGYFQDILGVRHAMIICLTTMAACMLALPFIRADILFFAFAVLYGFASGGDIPQIPAMAAHCFGVTAMGVIYGLMMTASNLSGAVGPIIAGYLFDLTESYTVVFLASFALLCVAVYCISRVKETR